MKKKQWLDQIKGKKPEELKKMVIEYGKKLEQLGFDLAAGKVKNSGEKAKTRKERARILTKLMEDSKK